MARETRSRPRQARGEPVVRRIFDVTLAELARVGFGELSVPEVARRAGVNKTSVYRRWPTREELVRAALDSSMQHARDVPDTGSFRGDMLVLLARVAEFLQSPRGAALLRTLLVDGNRALGALPATMWAEAAGESPAAIVQRALSRGELQRSADAELLLFTAAGAVMHRLLVERAPVDERYSARLLGLLLDGVGARPVKARGPRGR